LWDPKVAREILRVFLELQNEEGQCPQNIAHGKRPNYQISNPPLLAWALIEAAEMDDDYTLLEQLYPRLSRFHRFLYENRRKNGLFVWKHSYESGIDNSPRFTDVAEKKKYDINHLWAVDFNAWMVVQNNCLAKIANKLGLTEDSNIFMKRREELKHLINKYLWDEKTGLYYDYDYQKKELNKIPTIASLFPMFAEIPDQEQAKKIITHIRDEFTFNTLIPFPSVARNYPDFMKDCWRGAVWINTAYIGVKGLEKYGEHELAGDLAFKLVYGIAQTYRNEGSIYEFYDPDSYSLNELTRKKGNLYKQITLGGKPVKNFVGWTGLSNTMLIENVLGIRFCKNELIIQPHLPELLLGSKIAVELPYFDKIVYIQSSSNQQIDVEVTSFSDVKSVKASEIFEGKNHEILIKKS
jgi:putative isomerase